jgi:DNA repair exonuclease SbcCD ATPase subunit
MGMERNAHGYQFLPVGEAAFILGISRVRLREAVAKGIIPAQRDNQGRVRVDISRATADLARQLAETPVDPSALIDALFDEVEELQAIVLEREASIGQMEELIERQDRALQQTVELLEQVMRNSAGPVVFPAGQALAPSPGPAGDGSLAAISDRALAMLDDVTGKLEASLEQNRRYQQLIDRAMAFSDAWANATEGKSVQMADAAERAIDLLERALHEGEAKHHAAQKLGGMVDRALAAGAVLETEVTEARDKLNRQEKLVGQVLEMSERAVNLAEGTKVPKRGFLAWLTGR